MGHTLTPIPFIALPIKVRRMISATSEYFHLTEVPSDRRARISQIDDNPNHLIAEFHNGRTLTGEFMEFIAQ